MYFSCMHDYMAYTVTVSCTCIFLCRDQDEEEDPIDNIAGVNLKVSIITMYH